MQRRCWVNGEQVVIWAFNPTREALAVIVDALGTRDEPGPWVQTGSVQGVLKLTDYYLVCRALPNDISFVPDTERVALMNAPGKGGQRGQVTTSVEEVCLPASVF